MYEARFDVLDDPMTNGEHWLQAAVLHHFPNPVVFDIGAHIGDWTGSLLRQCTAGDAVVHAFEPCRGTFELLERRALKWKGVTLTRAACSDRLGIGSLGVDGTASGINALVNERLTTREEVALMTVDAYCQEHSIAHINLMKVDTEGHDLSVLAGARGLLGSQAVDVIQFEYNHRWIDERKLLRDAFEFLLPLGYRIGKLTGNRIQPFQAWHWELENTEKEIMLRACRNGLGSSTLFRLSGFHIHNQRH